MNLKPLKGILKQACSNWSFDKNYLFTFIIISLFLVPNIYLAFKGVDFDRASLITKMLFIFLSFCLHIGVLVFIRPKFFFLISLVFISFIPFEIFIINNFYCSINSGILLSIINTNFFEVTELLYGVFLFIIGSFVFVGIYIYLGHHFIPFSFKIPKNIRILFGIIVGTVLLSMWLIEVNLTFSNYFTKSKKEVISYSTHTFLLKFTEIFPYNYILASKDLISSQLVLKQYKKVTANFNFFANKKDTLSHDETYVLIIGEASRKHNYQIYNYSRQTTPYLSKQKNLIVFSDYISNGNLTFYCLPLLLTRATPDDFNVSYKEKSFISAFKEAGFKTYWISNNAIFNSDNSRITTEADVMYDLNGNANNIHNVDECLIPYLDSVLHEKSHKKFIIINLMGSHFRYNYRYTEKFNVFKPGLDGAFAYDLLKPENKERFMNIYDNSILYTDYILHLIFEKVEQERGIGLAAYISDHGENMFDDDKGYFTHGLEFPTKYEVEVPLVIWYSDLYNSIYSSKVLNLQSNKNKSASSENIFYSILDAANIFYQNEHTTKSIFSSDFVENSERLILNPKSELFIYKHSGEIVKKE